MTYGETYWIVLELQVPPGRPSGLGTVTVQYVDTAARENRRDSPVLGERETIPTEVVLTHSIGLWTSEVTFYALDDLYQNDRETAKTRLSQHIQVLEAAFTAQPIQQFRDDQTIVRKLISLTANLGRSISWDDTGGGGLTFAMNQFGQVRSGYVRRR